MEMFTPTDRKENKYQCICFLQSISSEDYILIPAMFLNQEEERFIYMEQQRKGPSVRIHHSGIQTAIQFLPHFTQGYAYQNGDDITFGINFNRDEKIVTFAGIIPGNFIMNGFPSMFSLEMFSSNAKILQENETNQRNLQPIVKSPFYGKESDAFFFEMKLKSIRNFPKKFANEENITGRILFHGTSTAVEFKKNKTFRQIPYQYFYLFCTSLDVDQLSYALNDLYHDTVKKYPQLFPNPEDRQDLNIKMMTELLGKEIQHIQDIADTDYQSILQTACRFLKRGCQDAETVLREWVTDDEEFSLRFQFTNTTLFDMSCLISYQNSSLIGVDGCFQIRWPFPIRSKKVYQAICDSLIYHCILRYAANNEEFCFFVPAINMIQGNSLQKINIISIHAPV